MNSVTNLSAILAASVEGESVGFLTAVILILGSYLLGGFASGKVVARQAGIDLSKIGSGNPGATNVYRALGLKPALIVFAADAAKGFIPVVVVALFGGSTSLRFLAGFAAALGHCYPLTASFKGGKAVATACGAMLAVAPAQTLAAFAAWVVVLKITRKVSAASLVAAAGLPVLLLIGEGLGCSSPFWLASALAALIFARHRSNIDRLAKGEEKNIF